METRPSKCVDIVPTQDEENSPKCGLPEPNECDAFVITEDGQTVESGAKEDSGKNNLLYGIEDKPPWSLSLLMGLQNVFTMISSTLSISFLIAPALCIAGDNPARMTFVSTIIFVSGLATCFQVAFGVRLPLIQGGSFAFLIPSLAILEIKFAPCSSLHFPNMTREEQDHEYLIRIRELQGAIAVASIFQVLVGMTGLVGACISYITPLTIIPTITLVGLSLFEVAVEKASTDWLISSITMAIFILLSQCLCGAKIPFPSWSKAKGFHVNSLQLFKLFSLLLSMVLPWILCALCTKGNVFAEGSPSRTDRHLSIIQESPWFYVPYPFQWGMPSVSIGSVLGMLASVLSGIIESIGDYYACARLTGSPLPPKHAINRGIFVEGIASICAGIWGTGNGVTTYSQNIAAIHITKVGSRRAFLLAGLVMMIVGLSGKLCALFAIIPEPIMGGAYIILFAMVTAVGLSNLQMVDLDSSRNIFILGFSIFFGLSLPSWLKNNLDVINTGSRQLDDTIKIFLGTSMFVGGAIGFVLDNTIPGTREEKGLNKWEEQLILGQHEGGVGTEASVYDLPFGMKSIKRYAWCRRFPLSPTFTHCLSERQRRRFAHLRKCFSKLCCRRRT